MIQKDELMLHTYSEDVYLDYAIAVVKGRALAQVEDGLKPVHRRILYAMRQLGLTSTAKPVKSARVVGDVLGKYHPHGDQSVYDAMVRMAQTFTLRYPLITGQGNFGSLDGDSAAAMRYTEAKLSPISELLLSELGAGTVDFSPNYDGTLQEPVLMPARLPILLLNGTVGIAVGMAADVPPHNFREVAQACVKVVSNPESTLDDVLQNILGPDFPGGGQLVSSSEEIKAVYSSGRGGLRCRARWTKEDLARGQWQIVIHELPYQVSTRNILEQLDTLTNPQPPAGKKVITQQQLNLKQLALDYLEKATDESDKDNRIRLVLVPRNSKVDPEQMMAFLLANTSLEESVPFNMNIVGLDGRPKTKNLMQVLTEWASYRITTVRRRTQWELDVALKRIHVLEGRMTVYLNLDKVIAVIRAAEDPFQELRVQFGLSEIQADDILEMRLRQLNRLEGIKLEKELADLRAEVACLESLLASEPSLRKLIVDELNADCEKYADDRRTVVKHEPKRQQVMAVRSVVEEAITIVVSKNLWVKAYKGMALPDESFVFKAADGMGFKIETSTVNSVLMLDTKGRAYSFAASAVPTGRGEGAPLSTLIEIQSGAKPFCFLSGAGDESYIFAGRNGYGYTSQLKNMVARQRSGKAFLALDESELPVQPLKVPSEGAYMVCGSSEGKLLAFSTGEVKTLPNGGKGVMLMALDPPAVLTAVAIAEGPEFSGTAIAEGSSKASAFKLTGEEWLKYVGRRARKGFFLPKKAQLQQN